MPSLMAILGLNIDNFTSNLNRAKTHAQGAGSEISHSWGSFLSEKLGGFVSATAVEESIRQTVEWGEKVFDTAVKLGLTIEQVQRLDYALKLSGTSLLENTRFFEMLSVARDKAIRGTANPEQMQAFRSFGITPSDLADKNVNLVNLISRRIDEGMDQDRLMAGLRALGGRGASAMVEAFKMGLGDLMKDAPVVSDESIRRLKEAGDAMKDLWAQIRAGMAPVVSLLALMTQGLVRGLNTAIIGAAGDISHLFGGKLSGDDLVKAYQENLDNQDAAKKKSMDKALNTRPISGDSPEIIETKKMIHLQDELFKKQQANDLAKLSHDEKLVELSRRRVEILKLIGQMDKEHQVQAAIDIEDIDAEKRRLQPDSVEVLHTDKQRHHRGGSDLNSLQRIGGMYVQLGDQRQETIKGIHHEVKNIGHILEGKEKGSWHSPSHSH